MTTSDSITAILLDIEGTTTPIDFVYKVLFPYARAHVGDYLATNVASPNVKEDIAALIELNKEDAMRGLDPPGLDRSVAETSLDKIVTYLHWLMDRDSKATPLKSIQGKIWEAGYNSGDLRSQVFEDVPPAFKRWQQQRRSIFIYSSGSVLAQRLLFSATQFGDLTPYIADYFDTNIGAKKDAESYARISHAIAVSAPNILFVSDVTDELDAARSAGFETRLCVRAGNHPQPESANHEAIRRFDEIA
ncbi:MAG TPA: acireductone synthase [Blastocatellia bacterium]|nr:acireductone synthase [Blastocatellia bacterium]